MRPRPSSKPTAAAIQSPGSSTTACGTVARMTDPTPSSSTRLPTCMPKRTAVHTNCITVKAPNVNPPAISNKATNMFPTTKCLRVFPGTGSQCSATTWSGSATDAATATVVKTVNHITAAHATLLDNRNNLPCAERGASCTPPLSLFHLPSADTSANDHTNKASPRPKQGACFGTDVTSCRSPGPRSNVLPKATVGSRLRSQPPTDVGVDRQQHGIHRK